MYRFRPKSTALLKAGHYWNFQLRDGRYVCGVVIARKRKSEKIDSRLFLAGLLDWVGENVPCDKDLEGRGIFERGYAHIKAITEVGEEVRGAVTPSWGYEDVVAHTDEISTWGYRVIRVLAEKHYGKKEANQSLQPTAPSRRG